MHEALLRMHFRMCCCIHVLMGSSLVLSAPRRVSLVGAK